MKNPNNVRETGLIGSLQKGLKVLDMFRPDQLVVTVGEIATHLDLHKSSASRIASTLSGAGYLRPATGSIGFQLGGKLSRLGNLATVDVTLPSVAEPAMQRLVEELGETCHIGILDGNEAVTVGLVDGSYAVRMHSWVGKRSLAHLTAMGKVLLSGLSEPSLNVLYDSASLSTMTKHSISTFEELTSQLAIVRDQGFAVDDEELELGLRCVSAPIFDHEERLVASLTIAGSTTRIQRSKIAFYIKKVRHTADLISGGLGALRPLLDATDRSEATD